MVHYKLCRRHLVLALYALGTIIAGVRKATPSTQAQADKHVNIGINISELPVVTGGTGDPILFVHGFGSSKFTWRHLCGGLQDAFTYYAIDLPGSGMAPAPRDFAYSLEAFSDVVTD